MADNKTATVFSHDGVQIVRTSIEVAMIDGVRLRGWTYRREPALSRSRKRVQPISQGLLCLPSELGNSAEYQDFILALMVRDDAPVKVVTVDLRGRGRSELEKSGDSDSQTDAGDIIAFCDATNLHHCDVLVSGRTVFPLLLTAPKRPTLFKRFVFNDAAPQFEGVGIARMTALRQRQASPSNWGEAREFMMAVKGEQFPDLSDDDWETMTRAQFCEGEKRVQPAIDPKLERLSNSVDYDSRQPELWQEFAIISKRPIMTIRGSHSLLLTTEIVERTAKRAREMKVVTAQGQGHNPMLHLNGLPNTIAGFLSETLASDT